MNRDDYRKMAMLLAPEGTVELTHVLDLLDQVWESGRRSGAAALAARKTKAPITDWLPDLDELADYILERTPQRLFTPEAAREYASEQMEAMREWAEGKGERKVNWTMAAKGWIRRSLGGHEKACRLPGTSPLRSTTSRAAQEHSETFREAMRLNSPSEPRSPCPTSSGSGSRRTRRALPSSSPTQGKFL